jgi:hypothetical protein
MKYIITEEQDLKLRLLRRLRVIDQSIENHCKDISRHYNICKESIDVFFNSVCEYIIEDMYYAHFSDIDDLSEEWSILYEMIRKYIISRFELVEKFYNNKCGN